MKEIISKKFLNKRDLYHETDLRLINVEFKDSLSALKESSNVSLDSCIIDAKYLLWHTNKANIFKTIIKNDADSSIWYGIDINISKSEILADRILRECQKISLSNNKINGAEFGFKCFDIIGNNLDINSKYAFSENKYLTLNNSKITGNYLFQYNQDLLIMNSEITGDEALWHTREALIKNSVIKADRFGWYTKDLTLVNCKIIGKDPFAYCEDLKLIDCEMEDASNAFEYSSVEADINSHIDSVINPRSGYINAKSIGEIIKTDDAIYESITEINIREKE